MEYFKKSEALQEFQLTQLHASVEAELKTELKRITARLKTRSITFDDGMGSITIDIECRRGGHYIVAPWDQYHSKHGNFYSMHMRRLPIIKELLNLLLEYEELYNVVSIGTIKL